MDNGPIFVFFVFPSGTNTLDLRIEKKKDSFQKSNTLSIFLVYYNLVLYLN